MLQLGDENVKEAKEKCQDFNHCLINIQTKMYVFNFI